MVIFDEIRCGLVIEIAIVWQAEDPAPFEPHQGLGQCPRVRFVVVLDIAGMHDEIGLDRFHRWIDLMTIPSVVASEEVMAGGDTKFHWARFGGSRRCFEGTSNRRRGGTIEPLRFEDGDVFGSRVQSHKFPLSRIVICGLGGYPIQRLHGMAMLFWEVGKSHSPGHARTRTDHFIQTCTAGNLQLFELLSILLTRKFVCLLCGDFVEGFAILEHRWHAGRAGPKDNARLVCPTVATGIG